jgi:hypothetical protein
MSREQRPSEDYERPVCPRIPRSWRSSLRHLELVAKHDDLDVLFDIGETMNPQEIEGASHETEEEREGHGRRGLSQSLFLVKPAFEYVRPTRR